jgi:hypothetical protein
VFDFENSQIFNIFFVFYKMFIIVMFRLQKMFMFKYCLDLKHV